MRADAPSPLWPDEELAAACRAGDQRAWDALVDKYTRLVYSIPVKYRLPPEEASDIFQGVWADLYRDLPRIERTASLRSWLMTAAGRRCLLHKRRRQRALEMGGLDPQLASAGPSPAQVHAEAEREQGLRDAIAKLPERCRRLVTMLFFEQPPRPYEEVARELGLAEGSIGFTRAKCLERLRKIVREMGL